MLHAEGVILRRHPGQVLCVLWLGSSVGNLDPAESSAFFKDILRIGGASTQVGTAVSLSWLGHHLADCRWSNDPLSYHTLHPAKSSLAEPHPCV